jgi:thymidine kinase
MEELERRYNAKERQRNSDYFNSEILPELKKKYVHGIINKDSEQNRFKYNRNIVDYYPRRKRLCHVNSGQWFTVDEDEFIASRIIFLLNRK